LEKEAIAVGGSIALSVVVSTGAIVDNGPRFDQDNIITAVVDKTRV
jgi:hypothetical protein